MENPENDEKIKIKSFNEFSEKKQKIKKNSRLNKLKNRYI